MRAREESNLQPPGPQPGVLSVELRALLSSILLHLNAFNKFIYYYLIVLTNLAKVL